MSNDLADYDATTVPERTPMQLIPNGRYLAIVSDAEWREPQNNNPAYLSLTIEIIDGQFKSRKLWENLNLNHPSDTPQLIARQTLKEICESIALPKPGGSEMLLNKPLCVEIGHRRDSSSGEIVNKIKTFLPRDQVTASATPPSSRFTPRKQATNASPQNPASQPAAGQAGATAAESPPWKR